MFGSGAPNSRQAQQIEEESSGFLSDIKNFIGSISSKNIGAGGISAQNNEALKNQY